MGTTDVDRGRFTDAFLDPMRLLGDPVADEPVGAVLAAGEADEVNQLLHSLLRTDQPDPADLPEPVAAYLGATLELPSWADGDRIDRAQRFFQTWGVQISVCLFCASLPAAYACADGAQVLHLTARLDTDARRRVMETGQFLMDVLAPGSLEEGRGEGRRVAQRVRLMHAAVRQLIGVRAAGQPGVWDPAWGHPINQEDLAGTLLSFAWVPAGPLRQLGVTPTEQETEDYLHCWNVIGHQMGLREDLLTHDVTEAGQLVSAIRERQTAPSVAGTELTAALVSLLEEMAPLHRGDRLVPAMIRHLVGDPTADLLDVPSAHLPGGRLARWLGRCAGAAETDVARHHALSRLAEPLGREVLAGVFRLERGGVRAPFAIPTVLAGGWGIPQEPA